MKKRILSAITAAAMLVSLASCSGNGQAPATSASTAAPETTEATTTAPPEPVKDISCEELVDAAIAASEVMTVKLWPAEDAETEEGSEQMIKEIMGYDTSLFSEYSVAMHAMSVHLVEIVIAKPAEGKKDDALEMFKKRKDTLIDSVAFYPEQAESAEQTVYGELNNGQFVYLICSGNVPAMEEAVKKAAE